jgi:hypothetical protein
MKKYRFDHEKLDVYQLELQFIAWATPLIEDEVVRYNVEEDDDYEYEDD